MGKKEGIFFPIPELITAIHNLTQLSTSLRNAVGKGTKMNELISHLITVQQFCRKHPWPSESGLRWLIFNAKSNGFDKCVVRIGRRVLIDEQAFFRWAEQHRQAH